MEKIELYTYYGNISGMRYGASGEITLDDIFNDNKPPCLLRYADPKLKEYLEARSMTDAEERYLFANYCYDSIFKLHIIEIPASEQYQEEMKKKGIVRLHPAKVIASDPKTHDLMIFGSKEYLDDTTPKPMEQSEVFRYIEWYNHHSFVIQPDPVLEAEYLTREKTIANISYRMFSAGQKISDVTRMTGITKEEAISLRDYFKKNKAAIVDSLGLTQDNQR